MSLAPPPVKSATALPPSVKVGLVMVPVMVGASFCGVTVVPRVWVVDHVLVWLPTVALMSLPALNVCALSARRTVSAPGVPL